MSALQRELDAIAAETLFSGVVRVDTADGLELQQAYGLAHRGWAIANTIGTRFGIASGTKGLTALTVMSLVEDGRLELAATARSLLGDDLPLIDDRVTVEQLLAHRSGIGDYFDEDLHPDPTEHVMPVPVHRLATTEDYVAVLDRHPTKFSPGERFSYSNAGYVVLALLAERATETSFYDLVQTRVCEPAGMSDTAFLRSDDLPGRTALGYLDAEGSARTNVLHLPVRGSGDGGAYSTAADVSTLWRAFTNGAIVSRDAVREMVRPRSDVPADSRRYGLGFWLHESPDGVILVGSDAGVSFSSVHDPGAGLTSTVLSNTPEGAWPLERFLEERLPA